MGAHVGGVVAEDDGEWLGSFALLEVVFVDGGEVGDGDVCAAVCDCNCGGAV